MVNGPAKKRQAGGQTCELYPLATLTSSDHEQHSYASSNTRLVAHLHLEPEHATSTRHDGPHMMIDFYDIEIHFIPLGPEEWAKLPGHLKPVQPVNRAHIKLRHPNWMGQQEALICPDHFRLRVCPQKVLGSWNAFGSNDLRQVVLETAPLMLQEMGLQVTPRILRKLRAGEYRIRELHLAEQFHLRHYGTSDFLAQLRRRLVESHNVSRMLRGRGLYIDPKSRRCETALYNKLFEFHSRGLPEYRRRIDSTDGITRAGLIIDRDFQQHVAALGPRLEFRLGDHHFSPNNPLSHGFNWLAGSDTADAIYSDQLLHLKLPHKVHPTWARQEAMQRLTPAERKTYLLWSHGEPLDVAAGASKSITRHAKSIEKALGINIRQPAAAVLGRRQAIEPARVFRWENRVVAAAVDLDRDLGSLNEHLPELG